MHAKAQAWHTYSTRQRDGNKSSTEKWRALMLGEGNETNDNVLESNGQREQDKDERERGREWTGLSLISSVLTYIMHGDTVHLPSNIYSLILRLVWKPYQQTKWLTGYIHRIISSLHMCVLNHSLWSNMKPNPLARLPALDFRHLCSINNTQEYKGPGTARYYQNTHIAHIAHIKHSVVSDLCLTVLV